MHKHPSHADLISQSYCISFLLLPQQIPTNVAVWYPFIISVPWVRNPAQRDSSGSLLQAWYRKETIVPAGLGALLEALGMNHFQAHPDCWQRDFHVARGLKSHFLMGNRLGFVLKFERSPATSWLMNPVKVSSGVLSSSQLPDPSFLWVLKAYVSWTPVTHTCNPSYLGAWDQEDHGSRTAQANSSQDLISKITRAKWTRGVAQAVEHLLCKNKLQSHQKKKKVYVTSQWNYHTPIKMILKIYVITYLRPILTGINIPIFVCERERGWVLNSWLQACKAAALPLEPLQSNIRKVLKLINPFITVPRSVFHWTTRIPQT
jgi:hypothetical protein